MALRITFVIIGVALTIALYLLLKKNRKVIDLQASASGNTRDTKPEDPSLAQRDVYADLRALALAWKPDQSSTSDGIVVYGMVMDWAIDEVTATTVAFSTGDASIYYSTGGGIVGGIGHASVRAAATQFIHGGQTYLGGAHLVDSTPLPEREHVCFYFLTNRGIYGAAEHMMYMEDETSSWYDLFILCNNVITMMRATHPSA